MIARMCDICDGNTYEDRYRRIDELIRDDFWLLMSIEGDADHVPWTYTIGLTEVTGHPELAMVGACDQCAGSALNELGLRIRSGERFEVPTRYPIYRPARAVAHLRRVHPDHWETDRFGEWLDYYEHRSGLPAVPAAVQVVVADPQGRFPWEPGHRPTPTMREQLLLDAPPDDAEW